MSGFNITRAGDGLAINGQELSWSEVAALRNELTLNMDTNGFPDRVPISKLRSRFYNAISNVHPNFAIIGSVLDCICEGGLYGFKEFEIPGLGGDPLWPRHLIEYGDDGFEFPVEKTMLWTWKPHFATTAHVEAAWRAEVQEDKKQELFFDRDKKQVLPKFTEVVEQVLGVKDIARCLEVECKFESWQKAFEALTYRIQWISEKTIDLRRLGDDWVRPGEDGYEKATPIGCWGRGHAYTEYLYENLRK